MKALLALIAAMAAAAAALILLNTSSGPAGPGDGASRSAGAEDARSDAPTAELEPAVGAGEASRADPASGEGAESTGTRRLAAIAAPEDLCVLTGRVVEVGGGPIAGALVQLVAFPRWNATVEGAPITEVNGLATGPRTIEVTASEKDAPWASVKLADGITRVGPEELWSHSGSATPVAGETAEVTLD